MPLKGGLLESKASDPMIPTLVRSHSAFEDGTCMVPTKHSVVTPAPAVLDLVRGEPLLCASAVCHKDRGCTAAAPDADVRLAAPRAERGSDPTQADMLTGGAGMRL